MKIQQLKDEMGKMSYGMTVDEAIDKNICIVCKKPARFKTEAGKREYQISGFCEYCFDEEFMED